MRLFTALVLALASCAAERTSPVPTAATTPLPAAAAPSDGPAIFPPPLSVIGTATMLPDGTLVVGNPHRIDRIAPSDPHYAGWLSHIGGLTPGAEKPVPAWPDEFDAAKVEAAVRAYLARSGIDARGCHGDILGTDGEKNVSVAVGCKDRGMSLRLHHGSYEVTEIEPAKP